MLEVPAHTAELAQQSAEVGCHQGVTEALADAACSSGGTGSGAVPVQFHIGAQS